MHESYLLPSEVEELYRVSKDALRRWEREGHIEPARTPGGDRRYLESDVCSILGLSEMPRRNDVYLFPHEVAEKYKVSTSSLHKWEKEGHIKASRTPGGTRRYLESDVREMLGMSDMSPRKKSRGLPGMGSLRRPPQGSVG